MAQEKEVVNLNCLDRDDLSEYIRKHQDDPAYSYQVSIAQTLRESQAARLTGQIARALTLEKHADALYKLLPQEERW